MCLTMFQKKRIEYKPDLRLDQMRMFKRYMRLIIFMALVLRVGKGIMFIIISHLLVLRDLLIIITRNF